MRRQLECGIVGVSLLAMLWPTHGFSEDGNLTKTLTALTTNVVTVQSLETSFVQEKSLSVLNHVVTLKGKMYMDKPDRFAWHVFSPIRYSMVMVGETVRQWDAEAESESTMSLPKNPALRVAIDQMRQWFLGDYMRLHSEYRITLTQEHPIRLTFVPLDGNAADKYIKRISLQFRDDNRYVDDITVEEEGGDQTRIRFHGTRLDLAVPAEAWDVRFVPPEDREQR